MLINLLWLKGLKKNTRLMGGEGREGEGRLRGGGGGLMFIHMSTTYLQTGTVTYTQNFYLLNLG